MSKLFTATIILYWRQNTSLRSLKTTQNAAVHSHKKFSYRRGTARCVVSVAILPIATQQCRNYLYDKSWTNYQLSLTGSRDKIELCATPSRKSRDHQSDRNEQPGSRICTPSDYYWPPKHSPAHPGLPHQYTWILLGTHRTALYSK